MSDNVEISVVIPMYRTHSALEELQSRLNKTLTELVGNKYEIIYVNDRCPDNGWQPLKEMAENDTHTQAINLSRNFGQHIAISCGIDHCTGNWCVVMDGDLQDLPEDIPKLYEKAQQGFDVVLGERAQKQTSLFKKITSYFFSKILSWLTGEAFNSKVGNYRIMHRKVVDQLKTMRENKRFLGGLVSWLGFNTTQISVSNDPRFSGESSYNLPRLCKLAFSAIIAYSNRPLWLAIYLGFSMAALSAFAGVIIVIKKVFYGVSIEGWTSLMASLYFLGGLILATLGVLGIYVGEIFTETRRRPLYVIDEVIKK
jgi:glycosyltransferase involved in cell wall biosynthesis